MSEYFPDPENNNDQNFNDDQGDEYHDVFDDLPPQEHDEENIDKGLDPDDMDMKK